jgi:hypothetical protein
VKARICQDDGRLTITDSAELVLPNTPPVAVVVRARGTRPLVARGPTR